MYSFADGAFAWPVFFRKAVVYDGCFGAGCSIRCPEFTALQHTSAQRLEVARDDRKRVDVRVLTIVVGDVVIVEFELSAN